MLLAQLLQAVVIVADGFSDVDHLPLNVIEGLHRRLRGWQWRGSFGHELLGNVLQSCDDSAPLRP
eukprot:2135360-Alexandrium_andersonii.AAC.1